MNELIFLIEESPEGGYTARALGEDIFTEADTMEELKKMIRDAVSCHYEKSILPKIIRLHFVKEELLPL
ncbi:MAG: 2-oxoisovalerate dehydrogenase [Bacteroidia bacterium]|nr:2-oxoisovalerate dehydrogenase [Bacteroidia bacterium]